MKINPTLTLCTLCTAAMLLFSANAHAQLLQEKISVTFSGPVEVPGQVLPAGTYVFEALEDGSLTRILSADEKHILATLLTVPDENKEPMRDATVILSRKQEGSPQRVDAWFFPGESTGNEFLYTKAHSHKSN